MQWLLSAIDTYSIIMQMTLKIGKFWSMFQSLLAHKIFFQNLYEFQPTGQVVHAQFSSNKFKVQRIRLGGGLPKLCKLIFDQFVTDFEMFQ